MRAMIAVMVLASAVALPARAQPARSDSVFVHRQHDKLFPTCEGCHAGIATGDPASSLPDEAKCRGCDAAFRNTVMIENLRLGAGDRLFVGNTHDLERFVITMLQ